MTPNGGIEARFAFQLRKLEKRVRRLEEAASGALVPTSSVNRPPRAEDTPCQGDHSVRERDK